MKNPHLAPLKKVPGLAEAVKRAFAKGFTFSGRAARAEFWLFVFFYVVVSILLVVIWSVVVGPSVTFTQVTKPDGSVVKIASSVTYHRGWLGIIFDLACLIPALSLAWRRLHDRDHGGWWILMPFVFALGSTLLIAIWATGIGTFWSVLTGGGAVRYSYQIGTGWALLLLLVVFSPSIYVFVQLVSKGTPGVNRFGPPPYEGRP